MKLAAILLLLIAGAIALDRLQEFLHQRSIYARYAGRRALKEAAE